MQKIWVKTLKICFFWVSNSRISILTVLECSRSGNPQSCLSTRKFLKCDSQSEPVSGPNSRCDWSSFPQLRCFRSQLRKLCLVLHATLQNKVGQNSKFKIQKSRFEIVKLIQRYVFHNLYYHLLLHFDETWANCENAMSKKFVYFQTKMSEKSQNYKVTILVNRSKFWLLTKKLPNSFNEKI